MKQLSLIIALLTFSNIALSECKEFDGLHVMYLLYFDRKAELLEIPANVNKTTEQYINNINNYITLSNSKYASNEFHERALKQIEEETNIVEKEKLINAHSNFKYFNESILKGFIKLAEKKHTDALYCLGRIYEHGIGVDISYIKAWAWYNTAFAVEGMKAKSHMERVWRHLNWETEIEAQRYSDQYTYSYTNITSTPSITILR